MKRELFEGVSMIEVHSELRRRGAILLRMRPVRTLDQKGKEVESFVVTYMEVANA